MVSSRVQVRVPASTSNLGPGFDCLGLALNLYNTTTISQTDAKDPSDEGAILVTPTAQAKGMIPKTAEAFFQRAAGGKVQRFGFEASIKGDIPISRGLGSSVTVRLGILMGLAELVKESVSVSREEILKLLIELEGHPDNAVPSFLGGFAVCAHATDNPADGFAYTRVAVKPELSFVTLVPDLRLSTEMARGLLPPEVSFPHAVENAQRTARIAAAFCTGNYESLRGMFVDHLHQPFRQTLIPGFANILAAAREAGALGSFLSGAGSSLIAVTLDHVDAVSSAMLDVAKKHELPAHIVVLKADNDGAQVLSAN